MEYTRLLIMAGFAVAFSISALLVTLRMRRRMKRSLKRRVSSFDLVSYKTWNEVEEAERGDEERKRIHPEGV
jgi:hypothetical protein